MSKVEEQELWYDLHDVEKSPRKDGYNKTMYRHWCQGCKKDRGYGFRNKILKEPLCHACRMKNQDTRAKIGARPHLVSKETKEKISAGLHSRYGTDKTHTRIKRNLRSRLNKALHGVYKTGSAVRDLGCSIQEFKTHLESLFQDGMSWENYGKGSGMWNVDHIRPLVLFNLEDPSQLRMACHYTNLQPLWYEQNLEKRKHDGTF